MKIGIRGRLYALVALFALGCAALAAALIWLQDQRAWEARTRQLQTLVESATGVLEGHKKLADAGVISEEEAKKRDAPGLRRPPPTPMPSSGFP